MAPFDLLQDLLDLSGLLLELHDATDILPFPNFQREVLRLLQSKLPFDSALWGVGSYGPNGAPQIFSVFLFNQPQDMLASYEHVKDRDRAFFQALATPRRHRKRRRDGHLVGAR